MRLLTSGLRLGACLFVAIACGLTIAFGGTGLAIIAVGIFAALELGILRH